MQLPKMAPVKQHFASTALDDVAAAVRQQLTTAELATAITPGARIAVSSGSRGIANIPLITRTVVDQIKAAGGEPFLYNCPYTPQLDEVLSGHTFAPYVARNGIERVQVQLEPGDLYFFFSENIHEVPPVQGEQPRAVLAIFFALSPEHEEIFVWA